MTFHSAIVPGTVRIRDLMLHAQLLNLASKHSNKLPKQRPATRFQQSNIVQENEASADSRRDVVTEVNVRFLNKSTLLFRDLRYRQRRSRRSSQNFVSLRD